MPTNKNFDGSQLTWVESFEGPFRALSPLPSFINAPGFTTVVFVTSDHTALYLNKGSIARPNDVSALFEALHWAFIEAWGWIGLPISESTEQANLITLVEALLHHSERRPSDSEERYQREPSAKSSASALKRLHAITASAELTLDQKIDRILTLGCELFALPFGIVSHVQGERYEVNNCVSPNGELVPGVIFDLGHCYCVHTLARDQVTGFYHAGRSEIAAHPCYEAFKLEAYLGVSLRVQGEIWGTLNFSSPDPRAADFNEDEYEMVKLFGQWIGEELTRHENALALHHAEQRYRLILESVHDGVIGLDDTCKITFANESASKITGYDVEELVGRSICKLISHESHGHEAPCPVHKTISEALKVADAEDVFYNRDGQEFPVKFACTPIQANLSEHSGSVLTFQDVSEQAKAKQLLQKQMELFRSLFMDAPEGIIVADDNRRITMANPYAQNLFGYSEERLIGQSPEFLYAESTGFETVGLAYADTSSPDYQEYRMVYRRADGSHFVAENVRSKIINKKGQFSGFIVHCRDITARLKIEEEVEKARDRLSVATQSAGIGVWELDLATGNVFWDDIMCRIYGVEPGEVTKREQWDAFVYPEDRRRLEVAAERCIATRSDLNVDFRVLRPDGGLRHIKANARVAVGNDDEVLYLFGVNFDITERHNTELILRNAREEAIRSSKAKSNFLATMSHEIRTPLNGVLGMAEILAGTELTERQHSQLDIIRSSGESLLELINEILDFSKIEAGHLALDLVDFDLEQLVFNISRLLVVKAEAKGIDLLVHFEVEGASVVHGDAYRIRQILINLVGNAIKFTERGHVLIRVLGATNPITQHLDISLQVEDTGIGIEKSAQGQLFQVFTQADNSTTRRFGGTGLGLAITKQLVDLMGGTITLESEMGSGSTFTVAVQLAQAAGPVKQAQFDQTPDFARILVVDDNDTNLSIIESQLDQCGLVAKYEQNAVKAVEHVVEASGTEMPYDLLILDYLMPDMDGLAVGRTIRDALTPDQWPRVLMISSAGTLQPDQLKEAGIKVCINKPASVSELRAGLAELVHADGEGILMSNKVIRSNSGEQHDLNNTKILVVEDMKANLAVVKGMLGQHGGHVEVAENGQEGIEKWLTLAPDLVLMDLHMPVMDGVTAIKEIRRMEREAGAVEEVPILVLTADAQPERIAEVEAAGANGYISKPFRRLELLDTIQKCLSTASTFDQEADSKEVDLNSEQDRTVDPSILMGLEEILGDQVSEIVEAFVKDAENIFVELELALSKSDVEPNDLYRPAHSLKSVSANVGAMQLSALAATLEGEAKAGVVSDPAGAVKALEDEFVSVKAQLKQLGRLV